MSKKKAAGIPARAKGTPKSAKGKTAIGKTALGFTKEERDAMRERAQELKAATGRHLGPARDECAVLAQIAAMPASDRVLAERLHRIVADTAPALAAKLWYGMPAYAKEGKIVCFFQSGAKFKTRYATLGFMHAANLDDGRMWPTAFALLEWSADTEARIAALLKKAAS